MAYAGNEVKSGVLITLTIALLLFLTFRVGNFTRGKTELWEIQFGYIGGLKKNAPVFYAGHEVGRVEKIEAVRGKEKPIVVTVRIPDEIELHEDSRAYIDTLGLMGEKFVELAPGSNDAPVLNKGTEISAEDPVEMYLLIEKMDRLSGRMDEMAANLEPLFSSHGKDFSEIVMNFKETSVNLRDMTRELKLHPWKLLKKK